MNERIRQLAEQASEIDGDDLLYYNPVFAEKFAELIIKECYLWVNENVGMMSSEARQDLNKHFGIE